MNWSFSKPQQVLNFTKVMVLYVVKMGKTDVSEVMSNCSYEHFQCFRILIITNFSLWLLSVLCASDGKISFYVTRYLTYLLITELLAINSFSSSAKVAAGPKPLQRRTGGDGVSKPIMQNTTLLKIRRQKYSI